MNRVPRDVKLVTVSVAYGMLRANVIRGLLESSGIPVLLRYEAAGPAIGLILDGLGRVEVQVPAEWENEALGLLAAKPIADATDVAEPDDAVEEGFADSVDGDEDES
jgi:hypothetical protein